MTVNYITYKQLRRSFPDPLGQIQTPSFSPPLLKIYGDTTASTEQTHSCTGLCARGKDPSAQNSGVYRGPYEVTFSYPYLKHILSVIHRNDRIFILRDTVANNDIGSDKGIRRGFMEESESK